MCNIRISVLLTGKLLLFPNLFQTRISSYSPSLGSQELTLSGTLLRCSQTPMGLSVRQSAICGTVLLTAKCCLPGHFFSGSPKYCMILILVAPLPPYTQQILIYAILWAPFSPFQSSELLHYKEESTILWLISNASVIYC